MPAYTFTGSESIYHFIFILPQAVHHKITRGHKKGTVFLREYQCMLSSQLICFLIRVVSQIASGCLVVQPLLDVSFKGMGFRGQLFGRDGTFIFHCFIQAQFMTD